MLKHTTQVVAVFNVEERKAHGYICEKAVSHSRKWRCNDNIKLRGIPSEISQIILNDFCVDDYLTGASSISKAINLRDELIRQLNNNGFELDKWTSNNSNLLKNIPNPNENSIYSLDMSDKKINWDDDLSVEIKNKWINYINDLISVNNLSIPRWLQCDDETREIEINGFSDASCIAYGACVYLTCTKRDGSRTSRLVCAKSRVAPLKMLSIPRLELCAAVLLSKLIKKFVPSLRIKIERTFLWTNSKVVLSWIASEVSRWKTLVANRVGEIHNLTLGYSWGMGIC
ncbi:Integrase catalytic domain-containing protein [Aphis craccivora]|uniref:Integrase catalytic domain-containing protein n=1 Tax=Aphis craccivora TaxID=307492 RepID=A0A6G0W175_APHCR|nr:Integrase catalytic domain-containing protein [Aphis craccivora]